MEEGGDWDRRNRLKTYEGLYAMSIRDFGRAATCFFDTMATFTSTELMDYQTFVKYACFCCLVALDRSDVKSKVRLFLISFSFFFSMMAVKPPYKGHLPFFVLPQTLHNFFNFIKDTFKVHKFSFIHYAIVGANHN